MKFIEKGIWTNVSAIGRQRGEQDNEGGFPMSIVDILVVSPGINHEIGKEKRRYVIPCLGLGYRVWSIYSCPAIFRAFVRDSELKDHKLIFNTSIKPNDVIFYPGDRKRRVVGARAHATAQKVAEHFAYFAVAMFRELRRTATISCGC